MRFLNPSGRDMIKNGRKGVEIKGRGEEKGEGDEGEKQTATRVTPRRLSDEQARER